MKLIIKLMGLTVLTALFFSACLLEDPFDPGTSTPGTPSTPTPQSGVYVGLITFAGNATDWTNGPIYLDLSNRNKIIDWIDTAYASTQNGTALFYAVHKAFAQLTANESQLPADLEKVNVVTFTDGLDTSSYGASRDNPIEDKVKVEDADYPPYIQQQINSRQIKGKPITAYSIGVKGNDVDNDTAFINNLNNIASANNANVLDDFTTVQNTFTDIASNMNIVTVTSRFTVVTTKLSPGTKVRMVFDNPTNAINSTSYLEGTIADSGGYSLTDIEYTGLNSLTGRGPVAGTEKGTEVSFIINGLSIDLTKITPQQYLYKNDSNGWTLNSEYRTDSAVSTTVEKHSSVVYIVLDTSSSLNANVGDVKEAAKLFVHLLYNQSIAGDNPSSPLPSDSAIINIRNNSDKKILSWAVYDAIYTTVVHSGGEIAINDNRQISVNPGAYYVNVQIAQPDPINPEYFQFSFYSPPEDDTNFSLISGETKILNFNRGTEDDF
ncbi:MAG: VWA domain-containing protein [Treponema sp.]|jgi:hypothetical protein|nr:VWA domain-containing protein [Treponema sp.]